MDGGTAVTTAAGGTAGGTPPAGSVPLRVSGATSGRVLLTGPAGQSFEISVDEQLRAAIRDASAGAQPTLSPREIQARLRSGASAAQVAQEAGTSEERIRRWETPVLAERAAAAAAARNTRFARPPDGAVSGPLGRLVEARLATEGLTPTWDAHRGEGASWIITARHEQGEARWRFDGTALHALDAAARGLGVPEPVTPPEAEETPEQGDDAAPGRPGAGRRPRRPALPTWEQMLEQGPFLGR